MQWDPSPAGGFTDGKPWLPPVDAAERNVEDQRRDPGSMLRFVRALIRLRRQLRGELELLEAEAGVLAWRRGDHVAALNATAEARPAPLSARPLLETAPGALAEATLAPHAGCLWRLGRG